ncbi:DUF2442 domain-containing protein [Marinobacter psychrophilus]
MVSRLLHADPVSRQDFELSVHGIHWDALDEDFSVKGAPGWPW